jgi:hypothetical protein
MVKARRSLAILLFFGMAAALLADVRSQGIDIVILLDRSLSMAEENKEKDSRDWLTSEFIGPLVIPGDTVTLISFFGKAKTIWDSPIKTQADKKNLIRSIASLKANGRWTDIGNALDALKTRLEAFPKDGRFKYILMLTDEKQEAPPESRYFSKDGTFSHSFLRYTRKESHGAWQAITLGIGLDDKIDKSMQEIIPVLDEMPSGRASAQEEGIISSGNPASGKKTWKAPTGWSLALYAGAGFLALLILVLLAILAAKRIQSAAKGEAQAENGDPDRT